MPSLLRWIMVDSRSAQGSKAYARRGGQISSKRREASVAPLELSSLKVVEAAGRVISWWTT